MAPHVKRRHAHRSVVGQDEFLQGARSVSGHRRELLLREGEDPAPVIPRPAHVEHAELAARGKLLDDCVVGCVPQVGLEFWHAADHGHPRSAFPDVGLEHHRPAQAEPLPEVHRPDDAFNWRQRRRHDLESGDEFRAPGQLREDGRFRLPHESSAGDGGVRRRELEQPAVADGQPGDVPDHRRIKHRSGPELPAGDSPPSRQQPPPATPGRERQGEPEQQEECGSEDAEVKRSVLLERSQRGPDCIAEQDADTDEERGPDRTGQGKVEREPREAGAEDAGREIGGKPGSRQQPGGKDERSTLAFEPGGAPGHGLRRDEPGDRGTAQQRPSQEPASLKDQHVTDEDPRETGHRGRPERDGSARHHQPRRDAGEVFADQRRRRQQQADDDQREPFGPRQGAGIERPCGVRQPRGLGVSPVRSFPAIHTVEKLRDRAGNAGRLEECREMVAIGIDAQVALRNDASMLSGSGRRDQHVPLAVQDEHRSLVPLEYASQRTLVGVIEVSGVLQTQHPAVEGAEVGYSFVEQPQPGQL